jgi:hypothetical protein
MRSVGDVAGGDGVAVWWGVLGEDFWRGRLGVVLRDSLQAEPLCFVCCSICKYLQPSLVVDSRAKHVV